MSKQVHQGHRARKRFGQNFLTDEAVISQIVASINPQVGENLVEIGPGLAALTEPVARMAGKLNVVELDRDLAERLTVHPTLGQFLSVHQGDALAFDFSTLVKQDKPLRVFGNLPYNISTPLIFHLLSFADKVQDMHFMLQKEVVLRMCAQPNTKAYGRLTVMTQVRCEVTPVIHVPPGAFTPPPKVESAVIRLAPYSQSPYDINNLETLDRVCREAFNQRRKTIRNSLRKLLNEEQIQAIGLSLTLRPENLSIQQLCDISNYIDTHQLLDLSEAHE